jgi:pyruvate/2-oxoglutarate dehydrogenase complex dihydrolipoamide dehydrogenase (E3) component
VPSKSLLRAAHIAHDARRAAAFGIDVGEPRVDMRRVHSRVQDTIAQIYQPTTPDALRQKGIDIFLGPTRFVDEHTLITGKQRISARIIVICTGAYARVPDLPGLRETPFLTYDRLFDLDALPGRLLVLGAGPLGVEMAQAFGRLGAGVTVIGPSLLAREEPETQTLLKIVLEREGARVVLGRGTRVRATASGVEVDTADGTNAGDTLLVAAGRAPRVEGLELERAGVRYSDRGIPVDAYLRTNIQHIFACGDVIGGEQYSHLAGWQCFRAVRNALLPGKAQSQPRVLPAVTFTDPEVARVGLTEAEARRQFGDTIHVHSSPMTGSDRAVCDGEQDGFIKLITRNKGDIVGATIVASRAGEMISEVAMAMEQGLGIDAIAETIHPYTSWSSAIQLAAVDVMMERLDESRLFRLAQRWSGLEPGRHRDPAGHPQDGEYRHDGERTR